MKSILLLGAAVDAADRFCDAGRELAVNDSGDQNTIGAERAARLVEIGRAVDAAAEPADEFGDATVADLRKIAEEETIDLGTAAKKDDIKSAIRAAREAKAGSGQDPLTPPAPGSDGQA